MALDELTDGDGVLEINGIEVAFNKQDKLYIHKSTIDYHESFSGNGFKVTPFFNGFTDC